jgi:hypothetical protein
MWIFVLDGELEFEASDGERQPARPGDALLLEDTIGLDRVETVTRHEPVQVQ